MGKPFVHGHLLQTILSEWGQVGQQGSQGMNSQYDWNNEPHVVMLMMFKDEKLGYCLY
jgi:hypothetical protein